MADAIVCDESLLARLPLPLAQLYRRAHNAKTPLDRHHAAFYLWEAALKLLGSVAVIAYAELPQHEAELTGLLQNLARPALGHWWQIVRRLLPVLAEQGDPGFVAARDLVLGRARNDLPRVAGLDAALVQALDGRSSAGNRVRVAELFDRLVTYRNRELGHGASGQRPTAFYDRLGRALLAGIPQLLERLDVLAGRRLMYVSDIRRLPSGRWLVERYELRGEAAHYVESPDLPEADQRLLPERLYLAVPSAPPGVLSSLDPLLMYDFETGEVYFLKALKGKQRTEYLCYHNGKHKDRDDLAGEQRALLARVLDLPADAVPVEQWTARLEAEEPTDSSRDKASAIENSQTCGTLRPLSDPRQRPKQIPTDQVRTQVPRRRVPVWLIGIAVGFAAIVLASIIILVSTDQGETVGRKQQTNSSFPVQPNPKGQPPDSIIKNSIGIEFILIPPGIFWMGSADDQASDEEKPRHEVEIKKAFYLGKYEVTRGQFDKFVAAKMHDTANKKNYQGGAGYNLHSAH